ncbi:MAG: 2-keto-4-pentenoate hydratase [Isosphaerales bacterium]
MDNEEIQRLAIRQLADYDARTPGLRLARPLELTIAQAYALQSEVAYLREQRGEKVIGYKIGCTSQAVQEQLGIAQPIFGRLYDSECHRTGVRLSVGCYANLAVEGEMAVRLSRDLPSSPLSEKEYLDAVDTLFPVIELHHYVLRNGKTSCTELIANNGMHGGFVLAEYETRCRGEVIRVGNLTVRIDEVEMGVVTEPWTMGGPSASLRWLAGRLAEFGLRLLRGQVVLTGSPLRLFPVGPCTRIVVDAWPLGQSVAEIDP